MIPKIAKKRSRTAHEHRKNGDFVEAGEYYTSTAHLYFSDWPPKRGKKTSQGEYFLLLAGTCYRLGDRMGRARNRCQQGILIAEELLDRTRRLDGSSAYDKSRYAAWYEYIADFHLVSDFDGSMDAYERAKQVYLDEGDPPLAHREQEHMWLTEFSEEVLFGIGYDMDAWRAFLREATFSEWVEYKQNQLPDALDILTSQSEWRMCGEE